MTIPGVVIFDVNETLSDMTPMAERFAEVGAPRLMAKVWFASLRDGFALSATGSYAPFSVVGAGALRNVLTEVTLKVDLDSAVDHVMAGFSSLGVHPDVPDGVRALTAAGARLFTLSNGSVEVGERLFDSAGIRQHFERLLSVDEAGVWKPAAGAYAYAARLAATDPSDMMLVAVHPWDIDGATRAGLRTCWINRTEGSYPGYFRRPEITVTVLPELAGHFT